MRTRAPSRDRKGEGRSSEIEFVLPSRRILIRIQVTQGMSMRSFSAFCAYLGCPLTNVRWSWCAISPDGKRAVFTIWDDELKNRRYVLYPPTRRRPGEIAESVDNKLGADEIFRVAKFVVTHPEVEALGILSIAKDRTAAARERKTYDDDSVFRLRVEEIEGEIIATTIARPTVASVLAGSK